MVIKSKEQAMAAFEKLFNMPPFNIEEQGERKIHLSREAYDKLNKEIKLHAHSKKR